MSFKRPDPSSPASIADASFGTSRRGFDQGEVREFLRMVAAELGRLQERERFLERELREAQANPDLSSAKLDDEALTRLLGEETARVLSTARESANEIKDKAEGAAGRLLTEAADEARRVREEAEVESARRRADANADAEAELDMAKQQGREMVNEARAYRERVLSELARRRELAREQIEQLIHGRDRLMQAFERARLVAVDVVAEMQPLGEPDEYVNLAPTTGPVPVMVANSPRPDEAAADGEGGGDEGRTSTETEAASGDIDAAAPAPDEAAPDDTAAGATDDVETEDEGEPEGTLADVASIAAHDAAHDVADDAADDDGEGEAVEGDDGEVVEGDEAVDVAEVIEVADRAEDSEQGGRAGDESAGTGADGRGSAGPSDDVVVDLFARIRADAGDLDDVERDDTTDETGDVDDGKDATDTEDATETEDPQDASDTDLADDTDVEQADDAETAEPTPFELRDEELTPLIVSSARKLKRVLADEQNEVLDALRRSDPVHALDDIVPPADDHVARYATAIDEELANAARAGAASVATGRAAKLTKSTVATCADAAAAVIDEWLVAPLRDRLERCVADGDGDNDAITKKVRAVYREWKTQHIDELLDDVLLAAHGRGVLAGFASGAEVAWTVDDRWPTSPDCHDNSLAGAVEAGSEFPTGHTFAPAHPGCRCLLAPVDR